MASAARNVYIVAAKRTPFGTFGGKLRDVSATQMSAIASRATLAVCFCELELVFVEVMSVAARTNKVKCMKTQEAKLNPTDVSSVCIGNVIQSSADAAYLARHGMIMRQSS